MSEDDAAPEAVYTAHLSEATERAEALRGQEQRLSTARLVVFLAAAAVGWLAFGQRSLDTLYFFPMALAFIVLLIVHDRVIRARKRAERVCAFFEGGLHRLADDWAGRGNAGETHRPDDHPYADDLDLFGQGSLFELICGARTALGEATLAHWLLHPAPPEVVRKRQQAVAELAPRIELRRDLSLLGDDVGSKLSLEALDQWGRGERRISGRWIHAVAALSSTLTLGGLVGWIFTSMGGLPFFFFALCQSGFALSLRARVQPVLVGVEAPGHDLAVLAGLLARVESEEVSAPRLVELEASLRTEGLPPSKRIAQLRLLTDLLEARRNQFFAPFGALLLWGTHLALALEDWRTRCGPSLSTWVRSAAELEALCSLAGHAYERPEDVFPEIVDEGPVFEGSGLGHPLIARSACVRNDVSLEKAPQALMMSGSNMSGKSTLLRTVGCAALLGLAGAPVRAERLRLSPLQVAASIRISDSLQAGASHFFAEITRLRMVVSLTEGALPVLFLLDEVLHGTNSHDRRIGASAVVRGLIERGAIGIVTTHDLALAKIADDLAPTLQNVHFQDEIVDGRMHFDYRLRAGIVTKSNAIELMRSVGLEV